MFREWILERPIVESFERSILKLEGEAAALLIGHTEEQIKSAVTTVIYYAANDMPLKFSLCGARCSRYSYSELSYSDTRLYNFKVPSVRCVPGSWRWQGT